MIDDLLLFAKERLIELQKVSYRYVKECSFIVKMGRSNFSERQIEFTFTIPQEDASQTVKDLKVFLNDKPVEYEIVYDQVNARFIKLDVSEFVKKGENRFTIQAVVERDRPSETNNC